MSTYTEQDREIFRQATRAGITRETINEWANIAHRRARLGEPKLAADAAANIIRLHEEWGSRHPIFAATEQQLAFARELIEAAKEPATKVTAENATEYSKHRFSVEASTLGLRPGQVPGRIDTDLGNGQPFLFIARTPSGWAYRQGNGCITLAMLND